MGIKAIMSLSAATSSKNPKQIVHIKCRLQYTPTPNISKWNIRMQNSSVLDDGSVLEASEIPLLNEI